MGSALPEISERQFLRRLAAYWADYQAADSRAPGSGAPDSEAPDAEALGFKALYGHYQELRRWNPRVSLVGPGTAGEVVERHYGESLVGKVLLKAGDRTLVDVGSGAGFPGLVLAVAAASADHRLEVALLEPRERKWLFLRAVSRRLGLSCRCLDARVDRALPVGLPEVIDVVTCRALATPPRLFELFSDHSPRTRFLLWHGDGVPDVPDFLEVSREVRLSGARRRRILEIRPK